MPPNAANALSSPANQLSCAHGETHAHAADASSRASRRTDRPAPPRRRSPPGARRSRSATARPAASRTASSPAPRRAVAPQRCTARSTVRRLPRDPSPRQLLAYNIGIAAVPTKPLVGQSCKPSSFFNRDADAHSASRPRANQRRTVFRAHPSSAAMRFGPHPSAFSRSMAETSSGVHHLPPLILRRRRHVSFVASDLLQS